MKIQKPIISNQISLEQITKCCNDDLRYFTEHFFQLEFTWMHNGYNAFKDFIENSKKKVKLAIIILYINIPIRYIS